MSRATLASLAAFGALILSSLAAAWWLPSPVHALVGGLLLLASLTLPGRLFDRLATADERKRDLAERTRAGLD